MSQQYRSQTQASTSDAVPEGDPLVLVTGASGYVATHVVQRLQQQGYRVRGTVRSTKNPTKVEPLLNLCPGARVPIELVEVDLMKDEGWLKAVKGCTYIMHTASPFIMGEPENDDDLIRPAVDGTLRVLKATREAGGVKRVVLTSSVVAAYTHKPGVVIDENNWLDVNEDDPQVTSAYNRSKMLAERAAWDFIAGLSEEEKYELAVINPSLVMGPPLCKTMGASLSIVKAIIEHEMKVIPPAMIPVCDVRDVSLAHVKAMILPEAVSNRHMICTQTVWFGDLAKILDKEFRSQGYDVTTECPPGGIEIQVGSSRMRDVLKITPVNLKETMLDMAYSMIDGGYIEKTAEYTGRN